MNRGFQAVGLQFSCIHTCLDNEQFLTNVNQLPDHIALRCKLFIISDKITCKLYSRIVNIAVLPKAKNDY